MADFSAQSMPDISSVGWSVVPTDAATPEALAVEVERVALTLGKIVPGRAWQRVERVVANAPERAAVGSLSSKFGLLPLPLHTDTAHWITPCRFLVMACALPGPVPTPTVLVNIESFNLSAEEISYCHSAVFLITNGKNSFYASVMASGRRFIRLDPGCMHPESRQARRVLDLFDAHQNRKQLYFHSWKPGEILVIDNWRVLHGRGDNRPTERGRILLRAMVIQ